MKKFLSSLFAIILVIVVCLVIGLFVPGLREAAWFIPKLLWQLISAFVIDDWVLYGIIALGILLLGVFFSVSKKTQRKLWIIFTAIAELVSLFVFLFVKKA